jgi:hypothetical protein
MLVIVNRVELDDSFAIAAPVASDEFIRPKFIAPTACTIADALLSMLSVHSTSDESN